MKEYDLIVISTGSAMNFVDVLIQENPNMKIAVVDKDEPGGICLLQKDIRWKTGLRNKRLIETNL